MDHFPSRSYVHTDSSEFVNTALPGISARVPDKLFIPADEQTVSNKKVLRGR